MILNDCVSLFMEMGSYIFSLFMVRSKVSVRIFTAPVAGLAFVRCVAIGNTPVSSFLLCLLTIILGVLYLRGSPHT